jgi:hypothetical protein
MAARAVAFGGEGKTAGGTIHGPGTVAAVNATAFSFDRMENDNGAMILECGFHLCLCGARNARKIRATTDLPRFKDERGLDGGRWLRLDVKRRCRANTNKGEMRTFARGFFGHPSCIKTRREFILFMIVVFRFVEDDRVRNRRKPRADARCNEE